MFRVSLFNFLNNTESALKASKRKAVRDPNRPKRQHTAYTMFVMENYEAIKKNNAEMPSKEIISMVARQWAQVSEEEKALWKERAAAYQATVQVTEVVDDLGEFYEEDENKGGDGAKKKRAASPNKKMKSTEL
jgi:hypothetical protein